MPIVNDYTAILGYLDGANRRWNATEDTGFPVFVNYTFLETPELPDVADVAYESDAVYSFSETQRDDFRSALAEFEAVSGVIFVETSGDAMLEIYAVDGSAWGGWANYPSVFETSSNTSSIVIDIADPVQFPDAGISRFVALHEVGHALGLSHPHEGGLTLNPALDVRDNTVMTYNGGNFSGLGPFDVAAVQDIYGAPVDTSGWSIGYVGTRFQVKSGSGDDRIWGVEGRNKLIAKAGDDIVIGRDGNDIIKGGAGSDILSGAAGFDRIFGGAGDDQIYSMIEDAIYSDRLADELFGQGGNDTIQAWAFGSLMDGGKGRDRLISELSATMIGGEGKDVLEGGFSSDTFVFDVISAPERDTVINFRYSSDSIEFREAAPASESDVSYLALAGTTDTLLKVDTGGSEDFRILFKDTTVNDLQLYFAFYHDFDPGVA
jgi:Ca2+-binding RTX toxin-like protein